MNIAEIKKCITVTNQFLINLLEIFEITQSKVFSPWLRKKMGFISEGLFLRRGASIFTMAILFFDVISNICFMGNSLCLKLNQIDKREKHM